MCVGVSSKYMYAYHMHTQCPWRSEESGITDGWSHHIDARN